MRDTAHLERIAVSEALLDEVRAGETLRPAGPLFPLPYDENGDLRSPFSERAARLSPVTYADVEAVGHSVPRPVPAGRPRWTSVTPDPAREGAARSVRLASTPEDSRTLPLLAAPSASRTQAARRSALSA